MDEKILQEILDELFPSIEAIEAQSASMQFLIAKGIASLPHLSGGVHYCDDLGTSL